MKAMLIGGSVAVMAAFGARAQTPETAQDIKCLAAYSHLIGGARDEAAKGGLAIGLFYYQGRIDGREAQFDLAPALKRVILGMSEEDVVAEGDRCQSRLQAKSRQMQAMGKSMADQ